MILYTALTHPPYLTGSGGIHGVWGPCILLTMLWIRGLSSLARFCRTFSPLRRQILPIPHLPTLRRLIPPLSGCTSLPGCTWTVVHTPILSRPMVLAPPTRSHYCSDDHLASAHPRSFPLSPLSHSSVLLRSKSYSYSLFFVGI